MAGRIRSTRFQSVLSWPWRNNSAMDEWTQLRLSRPVLHQTNMYLVLVRISSSRQFWWDQTMWELLNIFIISWQHQIITTRPVFINLIYSSKGNFGDSWTGETPLLYHVIVKQSLSYVTQSQNSILHVCASSGNALWHLYGDYNQLDSCFYHLATSFGTIVHIWTVVIIFFEHDDTHW